MNSIADAGLRITKRLVNRLHAANREQSSGTRISFYSQGNNADGHIVYATGLVEVRRKADRELGPKFDLRGLHDVLIGSGCWPLPILERQVDRWIAARRATRSTPRLLAQRCDSR